MRKAIYAGSFDPVTLGHLDIIRRASKTVSELIVGVLNNGGKTPLFTIEERVEMLKEVTKDLPNADVDTMFLATSLEYAYLSSTTVKEVAFCDGNISEFVPEPVVEKVQEKVRLARQKAGKE